VQIVRLAAEIEPGGLVRSNWRRCGGMKEEEVSWERVQRTQQKIPRLRLSGGRP